MLDRMREVNYADIVQGIFDSFGMELNKDLKIRLELAINQGDYTSIEDVLRSIEHIIKIENEKKDTSRRLILKSLEHARDELSVTKSELISYESSHASLESSVKAKEEENMRLKGVVGRLQKQFDEICILNHDLNKKNDELQKKTQEDAIKNQVPDYVSMATSSLKKDIDGFKLTAILWSIAGLIFVSFAVVAVAYTYINCPDVNSLTLVQIMYSFSRGLIGIAILCWVAKYCLSMTKNFTHEIVRRKDTIHSIRFGELFLKIFGSSVTKEETISVFKNWNNAGNTAFNGPIEDAPVVKLKDYGNDLSEAAKNFADVVSKFTSEKK